MAGEWTGADQGPGGSVACRMPRERIYTRTGDDGTTGLLYGGRVRKDGEHPAAYGTVDEVQAVLGVARAHSPAGGELAELLIVLERDLWVLMSELATLPQNRSKLTPGTTLVTRGDGRAPRAHHRRAGHAVRAAHGVRRPGRDRHRGLAGPGARRHPPGRAPRPAGGPAAVARRRLPQPALRPAVDHGPLAGGPVPHDPVGRRSRSGARHRPPPRARRRPRRGSVAESDKEHP